MALANAVLLSVDSLIAAVAVAPLLSRASHRVAAVALFGVADGAASFLGTLIAVPLRGLLVAAPAAVALYGVYLIAVTILAGRGLKTASDAGPTDRVRSGHLPTLAILGALAAAMSVDNLVSGAAEGGASVAVLGCTSAALMLLGLWVGGRISHGFSAGRRGAWVGAGLMLTACLALVS